jgi:DNA mismatch repair ATPase MutS
MLIKKINENFLFPIEFDKSKKQIFNNLYEDLELLKTTSDKISIYQKTFNPSSEIGKECLKKWSKYYTTNPNFLKDTQKIIKNIDKNNNLINDNKIISECWNSWSNIKNSENFAEKFQYIEWDKFKFLNKSELFLGFLTFYEIVSPVLSLLAPIMLFIIPFIILKILKMPITVETYVKILLEQLDKHPLGQIFTKFKGLSWSQRCYLLLCGGMYIYQIYQNIISCYKFYLNTKEVNNTFNSLKIYLEYTIEKMNNYIEIIDKYDSHNSYKKYIKEKLQQLENLYIRIDKIPLTTFNPRKTTSMGKTMKEFYMLQTCPDIESLLLFTFGFNGYIETINGLKQNINAKKINAIKIKNTKNTQLKLINLYHPCTDGEIVSNTINMKENKIITGPNAAGKTTILKATIINVLLSQQIGFGFYQKGKITPFDFIHCYLNIPDTNSRDSLFQAEARRCNNILNLINDNRNCRHFCIFDELFSGTNPYEATATAYAYLNFIAKNEKVKFMLTTHYIQLCKFLKKHKSIDNFNMETSIIKNIPKYSYKLIKGTSKIKGGIIVLKQLNYPNKIIEDAFKIMEKI